MACKVPLTLRAASGEEELVVFLLLMREPSLAEVRGHRLEALEAMESLLWEWLWGHPLNGACAKTELAQGLERGRKKV